MYVVNIWVHPKYVVVVCKLQFIGEMLFVLVSPLLVVSTYLTENTEAYGLKLLESTLSLQNSQRFARQESTEMMACVAKGGESCLTSGD